MNTPAHDDSGRPLWRQPSVISLVLANAVPLFGVLVWGWEVFPLLLLFWSENIIIGVFNVLKMIATMVHGGTVVIASGLFLIPFFCVHYGMFTFVHGVFVLSMFGRGHYGTMGLPGPATFWHAMTDYHLQWAFLGLAVSRGISFVQNFLFNGEYRRTNPPMLMIQPYGRIVVLHVTILLGGALMLALHSPMLGLLVLVVLKTGLDLRAHLREREKFSRENLTKSTVPFFDFKGR